MDGMTAKADSPGRQTPAGVGSGVSADTKFIVDAVPASVPTGVHPS
jgi:hypothetical protein